jgi:hypothetical protein
MRQQGQIFRVQAATSWQGQQVELHFRNMSYSGQPGLELGSGGLMENPHKSAPGKLLIELWKQLLGHCLTQLRLYSNLGNQPVAPVEALKRESPREGPTWCLGLGKYLALYKNHDLVGLPYRMVRVEKRRRERQDGCRAVARTVDRLERKRRAGLKEAGDKQRSRYPAAVSPAVVACCAPHGSG